MDRIRFGRALRALRRRRRWRQVDLGVKAGISQSDVSRIELGQLDAIAIGRLDRLAMAVGARLEVRLLWNGEGLDRLLDADHANLVDSVVRRLKRARWEVAIANLRSRSRRARVDRRARVASADVLAAGSRGQVCSPRPGSDAYDP